MLTCDLLDDAGTAVWQDFAVTRPRCGIYHHVGWKKVIETAYGHSAPYLLSRRGNHVTGILPLVFVRSHLFGNSLTSLPFLDFAGVVADDEESRQALLAKARDLGRELNVDYIEFRQIEPNGGDFETSTQKVLMTLELQPSEDEAWKKLPSERRNRVRRALKSGLAVDIEGAAKLPVFYDIWTKNMRDLGSPPHSLRFFEAVLEQFPAESAIMLVRNEGQHIGAALALFWKDTLSVPWVSSLREHFQLYPNNVLYWEAMRFAIQRGIKIFDFGRSTLGSGTYEFKQRWGAVPTPLHWQFLAIRGRGAKPAADEEKFQLAVEIWKRVPVSVTRIIGPALRKNITA